MKACDARISVWTGARGIFLDIVYTVNCFYCKQAAAAVIRVEGEWYFRSKAEISRFTAAPKMYTITA